MSTKFDLNTLEFGTLNNFGEGFGNKGDPRRDNSMQLLRQSMADIYTPNALKKVGKFMGVVVAKRQANRSAFQKKASVLIALDPANSKGTLVDAPYFIYKVYIPELESRPYPLDGTDPVLRTYPDVYVTTDVEAKHGEIAIGGLVLVRYVDRIGLTDPMIIEYEGAIPLRWTGMHGNSSELAFKAARSGPLGYGGSARSTLGGPSAVTPRPPGVGGPLFNRGPKYTAAQLKPIRELFMPILDAINKAESRTNGYDAGNRPKGHSEGSYHGIEMGASLFSGKKPSGGTITIDQIRAEMTAGQLFASGRYQIIPKTLKKAVKWSGLKGTDKYDPTNQDLLGIILLVTRRGRAGLYLIGKTEDAMGAGESISQEWAGLPVQWDGKKAHVVASRGQSYYTGDSINNAHAKPDDVIAALKATRQNLDNSAEARALFSGA